MKIVMLSLAALTAVAAAIFAKIAWCEYRRFRFLRSTGTRAKGVIFSEAPRRIGEAPLPVVRFEDDKGTSREFRSHFPRRTRGFIHPEEVEVLYRADSAEIAAAGAAGRWIASNVAFAIILLSVGLVFVLLSTR